MDLVIGGAYQGKKDFAMEHFSLAREDIYTCTDGEEPDWNRRCIEHLENTSSTASGTASLPGRISEATRCSSATIFSAAWCPSTQRSESGGRRQGGISAASARAPTAYTGCSAVCP